MIIVGIDPGLTGAVAVLDVLGKLVHVWDMPTVEKGGKTRVKREVHAVGLASLLRGVSAGQACVESVASMSSQGVAGVFSLGDTFGTIRGVCGAMQIPLTRVTPQAWKKGMGVGKDKEKCRELAIELSGETGLFKRKKDHNRAEAYLIALYHDRRMYEENLAQA